MSALEELNTQLFEQLNRVNDPNITSENLAIEIKRTKAVADIGTQIINNARLALDVQKSVGGMLPEQTLPKLLSS